jgi:hypothetical protein
MKLVEVKLNDALERNKDLIFTIETMQAKSNGI